MAFNLELERTVNPLCTANDATELITMDKCIPNDLKIMNLHIEAIYFTFTSSLRA